MRLLLFSVTGFVLLGLLSGCGSHDSNAIDYKSAPAASSLIIPPDLTQLSNDTLFKRANKSTLISASDFEKSHSNTNELANTAPNQVGDVRMVRDGNTRWLLIKRSPEALWSPIRDFWLDQGFVLTEDAPRIGIMETDWAENRAKIPQDFIRSALSKVFDSIYSSGERDKFRTRLERVKDGYTEIFISHKGMVEEDTRDKNSTVWIPAPNNPDLETEFLRRLMLSLGLSEEQSQTVLAATETPASDNETSDSQVSKTKLVQNAGATVLSWAESGERAWRALGIALDRSGFTIEDRNRSTNTYYVRYIDPQNGTVESSGFFASIFSSKDDKNVQQFQIQIEPLAGDSIISVRDANAQVIPENLAQHMLQIIAEALN